MTAFSRPSLPRLQSFIKAIAAAGLACVLLPLYAAETRPSAQSTIDTPAKKTGKAKNERKQTKASSKKTPSAQAPLADENPFESGRPFSVRNPIDRLVQNDLRAQGLKPMPECSDGVFLRRAYLDITGTIPSPEQARAFLDDKNPDKRAALIDQLLASDTYATYWTLKWGDLLRIKAEFPINLWPNAAQAYSRYITQSLRENTPLDRLAVELLTSSGSNFRNPPVNFFRAIQGRDPQNIAGSVALVFLGARADRMPPSLLNDLAVFFSRVRYKTTNEWKEEIVYSDLADNAALAVSFPDGTQGTVPAGVDPRMAFALWLTKPDNPFFARTQVNRIWNWVFGYPLYKSTDDLTPASKPINAQLADHLTDFFVKNNYDMRALLRHIFNSSTYQQSSLLNADNPTALKHFGAYPMRQLEAESLIDAICKVTGSTEVYTSTTPEPYTTLPISEEAIAIGDGSITTAFLDLFGRSPRDTGLADERDNTPSPAQRLHLLNASHIRRKIEQGAFVRPPKGVDQKTFIQEIYLRTLSRRPTAQETAILLARDSENPKKPRYNTQDIYWALINSDEFLNRH